MASRVPEDQTALELLKILGTGRQSADITVHDMNAAHRIIHSVRSLREARGEHVVGRKIGFSNRSIWARYGVSGPIWNYIWDTTVTCSVDTKLHVDLTGLPEPRIEPEVVFHLAKAPEPGMNEMDLLGCIDRVAHGFEIVQSVFPGWKFTAPSAAAAFGLHGALVIGPWHDLEGVRDLWSTQLKDFKVALKKDETLVELGHARNVLDGPVAALGCLVETIGAEAPAAPLRAGEIVTTGTLTDANPIMSGDCWSSEFEGIGLTDLQVSFR